MKLPRIIVELIATHSRAFRSNRAFMAFALSFAVASSAAAQPAQAAADELNSLLVAGKIADAEKAMQKRIDADPKDDQARFGQAFSHLLGGVEHITQSLYKYGFKSRIGIPLIINYRLPVGDNPEPEEVTYEKLREIVQRSLDDLNRVDDTLARLEGRDVKLPVKFGLIRIDVNGDGKADEDEAFWKVYAAISGTARVEADVAAKFVITFDAADVEWLRGYCNLLSALGEMLLAHDAQDFFDRTAQLWFAKPKTPHAFLLSRQYSNDYSEILDWVAAIRGFSFNVREPERMKKALGHLQAMTKYSRAMWKSALAETDDENEWIPNPKQTGVIPEVRVSAEMVESWKSFLDELDLLLDGRKLIPFWRGADGQGVNLKRVFTEPRPFDLVYWVQGTAATPYLERGENTSEAVWRQLERVFAGDFIGFALWFN